jgi:glycosyltransferase involved in cell wall biosynthesis
MKLTLTQICKGELENLKKLYPIVKDHIDEWVVVVPPKDSAIKFLEGKATVIEQDFTQEIESSIAEKMREMGIEVDPSYRLFNFAAARNTALTAATGDYILWLDGDDEPIGLGNLKKFIASNPQTEVFDATYDYYRDEEGNSISDHVRERVIVNNNKFTWKGGALGLIHETLLPASETYEPLRTEIPDNIFRVKHNTDHVNESSLRNHAALLYEYLKTGGEDARTTYYLGIEYFNRGMFDYCIRVLSEYVKVSGWDEEKYMAYVKMAEAYHMLGDRESGRNMYLTATKEMPHYPHAYLGIGESYHDDEEWGKAIEFIMTGLQKKVPKTKYVIDRTRLTFRPAVYVALSYLQLGKQGEAYSWFVRAAKMNPKHPWIKEYAPLFQEAKDLDEYVKSFVKIGQLSQRLYPKTLSKLADAIPDELMDQELLMDFRWRYTRPKVWGDKSIVFFCSSAFEDWGPESLEKGCGGSEEAVIQLSKRLVGLGWDVTVYNNCIREAVVDGVKWIRFEKFNPRDIFNVIIGWRNNPFTDQKVASKRFIDMHDVPGTSPFYKLDALKGVKLLVKSEYHRSLFDLPKDKSVVIPNGIDLEQFPEGVEKKKNNLVWTSSYDRGLEHLLEMWPLIKKEVPDATLDVAYGFNLFDSTPWGKKPEGQAWKARMTYLLEQEGITHHGRLSSDQVAKLYLHADVFAYPSNFPEIDCISLTKAMAARCVPITTDFAVLKERNQGVIVEGNSNDKEVREAFKNELIALMKDDDRKRQIRSQIDVKKYSWDEIAKKWDRLLK